MVEPARVIRRAPSDARASWTLLPNVTLEDGSLSWDALGLLTYLLSKPDHWTISTAHLAKQRSAGRDKIRRLLGELEDAGYLTKEVKRDGGQFSGLEMVLHDVPTGAWSTGDGYAGPGDSATSKNSLVVRTDESGVPNGTPNVVEASLEVRQLCAMLAAAVARYMGVGEPAVTKRWTEDMRLLLERGPGGRAKPEPIPAERVERAITVIFEGLAEPEGATGFCWAAQVRSPGALRRHWDAILEAAKRKMRARVTNDPLGAISAGIDPGQVRAQLAGGD